MVEVPNNEGPVFVVEVPKEEVPAFAFKAPNREAPGFVVEVPNRVVPVLVVEVPGNNGGENGVVLVAEVTVVVDPVPNALELLVAVASGIPNMAIPVVPDEDAPKPRLVDEPNPDPEPLLFLFLDGPQGAKLTRGFFSLITVSASGSIL